MQIPSIGFRIHQENDPLDVNHNHNFLNKIHIYQYNSIRFQRDRLFGCINKNGLFVTTNEIPDDVKIVSYQEFESILTDWYSELVLWRTDLKVGDIVTIDERRGGDNYYCPAFTMSMKELAGKQFEIMDIHSKTYDDMPYVLGDYRYFILKDSGYFWHSSMFVMERVPKVVLQLSSLGIEF